MTSQPRMRQARLSSLLIVVGGALLLSGCETTPRRTTRPEPITPVRPIDTARNGVALLVPLIGVNGGVGQSIANSANLALLDSGNKTIRLSIYNTAEAGAAAAARKALSEGNQLILGPLLADDVRAVAPVARQSQVPVIAFSNDSQVAGNGVFIMGTVPNQSIERVVSYAKGRGITRFGALVPTGLYGQRSAQALLTSVQKSGGRVTAMQTYTRSPAGVRAAVRSLTGKGQFDAALIADSSRIGAVAAPLLKQGKTSNVRLLGTELWGTETNIGATTPALRGTWYAAVPNAAFSQLVTRYNARYGRVPYRLGSLGYDAMLLTVRASRNWPIGSPFPVRALVARDGFAGVDGIFRFNTNGIAERALEVRQVTATGSSLLAPAQKSF